MPEGTPNYVGDTTIADGLDSIQRHARMCARELVATRTRLNYSGMFSLGWGPVGWLIGLVLVKPLYDRTMKAHLRQAKQMAEQRAARSGTHGRP